MYFPNKKTINNKKIMSQLQQNIITSSIGDFVCLHACARVRVFVCERAWPFGRRAFLASGLLGKQPYRQPAFWANSLLGKQLLGKQPFRKLAFWANSLFGRMPFFPVRHFRKRSYFCSCDHQTMYAYFKSSFGC